MRTNTLIWALLLSVAGTSAAQEQERLRMPYSLKLSPFALVNLIQESVTLQADIPLSPRWGLDAGVSGVFYSSIFAQYKGEQFGGYKLRPIFKYYFHPRTMDYRYIGIVLKFSDLYNRRYYRVVRQGGQYQEWLLLRRRQVSAGVDIQLGGIHLMGKQKRWFLEPFWALGLRWIHNQPGSAPPDAEVVRRRGFFDFTQDEGSYVAPDWMMGVNVGRMF